MHRGFITREGITLSYLDSGSDGPAVLFLHGLAGQASEWASTMEALGSSFRTLSLDQRGHGRSDKGVGDFSREAYAADAAVLLRSLGIDHAVVVGQSMGGVNAIVLAARHPDLVSGLVIVEADASPSPGLSESIARWLDHWPVPFRTREEAVSFFGGDSLYARTWAEVLALAPDGLRPNFNRPDMLASVADMEYVDRWEQWLSIRCPALLVAGTAGLARRDEMQRMAEATGATYLEIEGAGHDLHLEAFDEWASVLETFLRQILGSPAIGGVDLDADYSPMMPEERAEQLRQWHEQAYQEQRSGLPTRMRFMGLDLHIDEDVFAPHPDEDGSDPFHQTVEDEARAGERVLDMGTGSGVSGILAARQGAEVVATDVNPKSVKCARANAERNGVAGRITFAVGDLFEKVKGDFDLIIFDPPFRWFRPRDVLERGTADEDYRTLRAFMEEAPGRLRPGGRILLNFGTSGDLDYLLALAHRTGLRREMKLYGEASRAGVTARYYTILLAAP